MNHSTENLKHTVWECKYHVVFIPKYRKKVIYGGLRNELGPILRDLAQQQEAVVVGYIKGKSAIAMARRYMGRVKNFVGQSRPDRFERFTNHASAGGT